MPDSASALADFYRDFGRALDSREAALFAGAGLSRAAGMKTWPELLSRFASDLHLELRPYTDLVALAQFHYNERRVRTNLSQLLRDEYDREVPLTANHGLIANLPLETVWTTNYDRLLERAFEAAGKRYDAKVTQADLTQTKRGKDVTIYKMHGDVTQPEHTVLIKEDYELYNWEREAFTTALRGDLVDKTFLFVGFSFTDPNMDYILGRMKALLRESVKQHFCIMKWPSKPNDGTTSQADYDYNMRWLELRTVDLMRYGIKALMIQDYSEITDVLRKLNQRAHRNNIFVSGSTYEGASEAERRAEKLARAIGQTAIQKGFNIVSGFGLGVGNSVLLGALEEVYRNRTTSPPDRLLLRPFPQLPLDAPQRADLYTAYRRDILSLAGFAVFVGGIRQSSATGQPERAEGVMEEFAISSELGKHPIPVGATGGAAREIWQQVSANPSQYFSSRRVKQYLAILGDESKSDEELVAAVFAIIQEVSDQ